MEQVVFISVLICIIILLLVIIRVIQYKIYTINGELIHKIVCMSSPYEIAVDNNNNIIRVCHDGVLYLLVCSHIITYIYSVIICNFY